MWLPNARRVNLGANVQGGPYDDMRRPKVCWHRTQGSGLAGARGAFAAYPPHIGYDAGTRELEQYVSLLRHSYAFFNSEADDEYIIQIELVGFSEQSQDMPDWQVQNIVTDLVDPLEELIGVPPVVIWHGFRGAGEGIVLARADSPIRISLTELREFSGHLGHQHIPGDGHWDPGRFRIDEVLRRSQGQEDNVSFSDTLTNAEGYSAKAGELLAAAEMKIDRVTRPIPVAGEDRTTDLVTEIGWLPANFKILAAGQAAILAAVLADKDITPEQFQALVDQAVNKAVAEHTPTAEQNAAALSETLVPVVEVALKRVQDTDNLDEAKQTAAELLRLIATLVPPPAQI